MADGFVPPQEVRSNAKRGLELREKYGRGGTAIGVARARDLSNGASLPLDTIKRMNSYFARHEVDKKGEGWGKDSAGYIAWLLWGGDAGWSWAKKIIRENESKEKSMALDLTTSYFSIEKADRNDDGTLTVYGKATDDSLDIDQQICDAGWLDRAMPEWFKSGGNIREQHSQIAAGVAKEYEAKADGHYISALVVDPNSVKKVETGVLKGFSIGIKSPRVVRDQKAANGRIIDGQIVEVSLVDRPANPNAKLMLAKSVEGEPALVQVEEFIDTDLVKHPGHGDQSVHGKPKGGAKPGAGGGAGSGEGSAGGGAGSGSGSSSAGGGAGSGSGKVSPESKEKIKQIDERAKRVQYELRDNNPSDDPVRDRAYNKVNAARQHIENAHKTDDPKESAGELKKARAKLETAKTSLEDQNYHSEAETIHEMQKDLNSLAVSVGREGKSTDADLRKALQSALHLYAMNKSEDVSMEKSTVELPVKVMGDILKFDKAQYEAARDALANLISIEAQESKEGHNEIRSIAHLLEAVSHLHAWYEGEEAEGEVVDTEEEVSEVIEDKAAAKKEDDDAEAEAEAEADDEADDEKDATADDKKCADCGMKMSACKCDMGMKEKEAEADAEADAETCPTCKKAMKECACKSDAATDQTPTYETQADLDGTTNISSGETAAVPFEATVTDSQARINAAKSVSVDPSTDLEALVEEVVNKATTSLKAKIAELVTAKEAALEKSMSLEAELATAKSLAVAGGPKRTAGPISIEKSDLLTKAAIYKAKAAATTDTTLAKGFKALADEYLAKATEAQGN